MIDPDREALALLLGACMGCKYIELEYAKIWKRVGEPNMKIISTSCGCPERNTKQTYKDNVCKYWKKK